jgi:thiamine pyrophosphate-dependent acetolactate synthase large subunit-like protein
MYESADVVLAVGTSLSYYVGGGHYWAKACKIQLDDAPRGLRDGQKAADIYVRSDARVGVEAILAGLDKKLGAASRRRRRSARKSSRIASRPSRRTRCVRHRARVLDPREVIEAIDAVVPKDWDIVVGGGHQAYFNTQMRGRPAERYTTVREFGAVGNGLSYALGVAAARRQGRDGKIVLFEGDGGLLFHIQELETLKRQGFAS